MYLAVLKVAVLLLIWSLVKMIIYSCFPNISNFVLNIGMFSGYFIGCLTVFVIRYNPATRFTDNIKEFLHQKDKETS